MKGTSLTVTLTTEQIWRLPTVLQAIFAISALCSVHVANCEMTGLLQLSAGVIHTCAVTTAGGAKCWGGDTDGQLGDGSATHPTTAGDVYGLTSGVSSLAAGGSYTCAVTTSSGAKCWGNNLFGQLGDGSTTHRTMAVDVSGLISGVSSLAAGEIHTCAVTTSGGAKCWGSNAYGQLGDGSTTQRTTAVDVSGLTMGVSSLSVGESHTCAVTTSGGAKCWGRNNVGQLGDGSTTQRNTAVNVTGLITGVNSLTAGDLHTCVVTTSGGAKCWGSNTYGQLGDGSTTQRTTAVDVSGLTAGVNSLVAGDSHTCAVTTSGGTKCWGRNHYGQLGDGSTTQRNSAVDVVGLTSGVGSLASGDFHTCAVTTLGSAKCWGGDSYGRLGDGSTTQRYTLVDVYGLNSGVSSVDAGKDHTCALTSLGGAKCWGDNIYGGLGDGSTTQRNTAVDVSGLTSGVNSLAAGALHTCALTSLGGAKCWGDNTFSQLGDGSVTQRTTAVNVTGLTSGVSSLTVGGYHTCVVTTSGGAKCWGYNFAGQLGDGSTSQGFTAVNVSGLSSGVSSLAAGSSHTCAVTTSGGAKCWGGNDYGQLGDGSSTQRTTAVDVSGLTSGVISLFAGLTHTCAVTTSGGAKCWGLNNYGQLGDGSTTQRNMAVDVSGLTSGVSSIDAGSDYTCAVMTSGGAKCWGRNNYGQLGDGSNTQRNEAVDVKDLTSGVSLTLGRDHTCAMTNLGGAKCWGSNSYGQLGEGQYIHSVLNGFAAHGIVTLSGSPLPGAVFRASGMGPLYVTQESTADGSGAYYLPIVETASYTITPELAGYYFTPPSITGTMTADLTQDFVATLITYNITGTVTAGGNPLAGATVDGGALGTRTTDASGNYAFNTITPATVYTLTVSHSGATFGVDTASGTLSNHATHDFSGTLNTYNIAGAITAGGNPLSGVTISGGALGDTVTDGSGDYSFAGVIYGTAYTITPSLADYDFSPASASGTLIDNVTADFTGVYDPPSTTTTPSTPSTSSGLTTSTSSIVTTTSAATTSTVELTTTVDGDPTPISTTSIISPNTSVSTTTTGLSTSSAPITSSVPPEDSDSDGVSDEDEQTNGTDTDKPDTDDDGVTDGEELTAGTNPNDPGSKAPKLRTTICSEWNGYLGGQSGIGMYNIMEHINLTTKKLRVKTELRSIRGHLKDTYEFFLRGNQQFDLLVHDFSGRETNSYGQICTTYNGAPAGSLDGRMVYYKFAADGGIQFAFALPFENPTLGTSVLLFNTQQPSLDPHDSENLVANWVQLSNVSRKRLKGKLYFHALDGSILGTYDVNLRDGARSDYSSHAWGRSAGLVRFAPKDNKVEYHLRGVRYLYDNPGLADSFASAYPFAARVGSGETLMAPVDGDAGSAVLELANTLAKKVSVSVALYDQTGKTRLYNKQLVLKAYSSEHLQLSAPLGFSTGLLTAKSSHTGSIIGSVVHYGRTNSQGVQNMFAIPLQQPILPSIKGSYNTYLNQGCTLYLGNASTSNEKVSISMRQNDGTKPVKDYSKTVPGRGVIAEDICAKSPSNVYGVVTVTMTKPKRIYGVVVREGEGGRYKMATELR